MSFRGPRSKKRLRTTVLQGNVTSNPNAVSGMFNCSLIEEFECLDHIMEFDYGYGIGVFGNINGTNSTCQVKHFLIKFVFDVPELWIIH